MERFDANNRVAYALCEEYGIDTKGMSPREAWEALKDKTGKSMGEIFKSGIGASTGKGSGKSTTSTNPITDKELKDGVQAIRDRVKANGGHYTTADLVECGELIERSRGDTIDSREHRKQLAEATAREASLAAINNHYALATRSDSHSKSIGFKDMSDAEQQFRAQLSRLGVDTTGMDNNAVSSKVAYEWDKSHTRAARLEEINKNYTLAVSDDKYAKSLGYKNAADAEKQYRDKLSKLGIDTKGMDNDSVSSKVAHDWDKEHVRSVRLEHIRDNYSQSTGADADDYAKSIGFANSAAAEKHFRAELSKLGIDTTGMDNDAVCSKVAYEWDKAYKKAYTLKHTDPHAKNAESLAKTLGKVRDVGGTGSNYNRKNSQTANDFENDNVFKYLPKDWVDASNNSGHFGIIDEQTRAFCSPTGNIHVNTQNPNPSVNMHETMHRMESCVKGLRRIEQNFYDYRKGSEKPQKLATLTGNPGYGREMAVKDSYVNPYMGKDYGGAGYELMSMGGEWIYFNPGKFSKDAEMRRWMYGVLAML